MAPTLSLQLIGPLRMLTAAGKPLSLPNRKTRALLAYLAQIARPQARLALSAFFCQNSDDPSRALRWHLTMIRRHLGPEALLASTDTVELNQEVVEVDARIFANVLSGDLTRHSIAQLTSTLELYRGEPFTGLALPDVPEFELWLLGQRAYLQQLYERGLAHLVDRLVAGQDFDAAVVWARQLVGANPLLEEGHTTLIWLYAHLGQRQAALDQYAHCRTLLQQEFAADPTPALAALVETIRSGQPLPAPAVVGGQRQDPGLPADFVGRESELAHLRTLWQSVCRGRGAVVLVEGEAGVGKSRLVQELARPCSPDQLLIGHCYESTQGLPGYPWTEILDTYLAERDLAAYPPFWQAQLARLLPALAGQLTLTPAGLPSSDSEAERLFTVVGQLLFQEQRPRLIWLEDLQWADETSLHLFLFIARSLARKPAPALLVGTFRAEEAGNSSALAALVRDLQRSSAVQLRLEPLSAIDVTQLVAHRWPNLPDADHTQAAAFLTDATGGNPLFLTEVLRELTHNHNLPTVLPVPASLTELVQQRLRQFSASGQQVLEILATLNVPATLSEAQQLSGCSEDETVAALDLGLRWRLLTDRPEQRYDFSHALLREAVLHQASTARRRLLHRRTAHWLAQVAAARPHAELAGRIVRHAQQGEAYDLVWEWAPVAAERAYRLYAHADALTLYEAAIAAYDQLPVDNASARSVAIRRQIELTLTCVLLANIVGRPLAEQEQWLQSARSLLSRQPDHWLEGLFFFGQATLLGAQARHEAAVTTALAGYERFRHLNEPRLTARCLALAGEERIRLSQNRAAQSLFTEALALFQTAGDAEGESRCRSGLAYASVNLGQVEVALAQLDEALAIARQQHDLLAEARVCFALAHAWTYYYEVERIIHFAQRAGSLFDQMQYDLMVIRARCYEGVARRVAGETTDGKAIYGQVLAAAQRHRDRWLEGWMAQAIGRIVFQEDDLPGAERWFDYARQCRQEGGETQNLVSDLLWLGRLRLAQGRLEEAQSLVTTARTQLEAGAQDYYVYEGWDVYLGQAEVLDAQGHKAEAAASLHQAYHALLAFAAQIPAVDRRAIFLSARPLARLLAAHATGQIRPYGL